ncbi:hypothetical protein G6F68_019144 [Rhizopus microsporus]|nr:hypothetical protein G6F68_019144 [Rhizopus microsporus]
MALGFAYLRHDGLQAAFHEAASDFVARCNEVVQLAVLDGFDVVYIAREDARRPVRLVSELGMRLPAHACALGKALLANLDADALAACVPAENWIWCARWGWARILRKWRRAWSATRPISG